MVSSVLSAMKLTRLALFLTLGVNLVVADTPANCTLEDVLGEWVFYEGKISKDPNIDCTQTPDIVRKIQVKLAEDYALENDWTRGTWTMIYNQGFEAFLNFRSYFAFFQYRENGKNVTSLCDLTFVGKSHDVTLRNYACFFAKKKDSSVSKMTPKIHQIPFNDHHLKSSSLSRKSHEGIVDHVNNAQSSWKAELHEPFVGLTHKHLVNLAGGVKSWLPTKPKSVYDPYLGNDTIDWRNFMGQNFVSPVRNQGSCGSCYAFSSVGMIEARLRVFTKNQQQPIMSPQDIVSCTALAQGCEGGFPYLIAGKYGKEKGLVQESCNPYAGIDEMCIREDCQRWYTAEYGYVGGRYGRCSEAAMVQALRNGPVSVSFNVYPDFMHYKSGIYHYTGAENLHWKSFIPVNHAVLLVGYGADDTSGEKYWIVKNSWGEDWGEKGYFRIRRGVDEVGIESIAAEAFPIPI